jgi:uncharacterized iron-regulated membrane protein
MRIRKVIFWLHLTGAVAAGLVILVLCVSGATMVFARQILDWSERGIRHPAISGTTVPLDLDEALARAQRAQPALQMAIASITPAREDAIVITAADRTTWFVNPFTGDVQPESEPRLEAFFQTVGELHTHLNVGFGQPIAAAGNVVLLFLAFSGLCLWWPRRWSWSTVRPAVWFVAKARGRARDWNWHNVTAIWFLPALVVLAGTGVVLSYPAINTEMFSLATKLLTPANGTGRKIPSPLLEAQILAGARPSLELFAEAIETSLPSWRKIDLEVVQPLGAGVSIRRGQVLRRMDASVTTTFAWPPFDTKTVALDSATGAQNITDMYASLPPARRARMWVRLLHSGGALGQPSRVVACLACFAACLLVYTGYAMALRRLFARIKISSNHAL